MLLNTYYLPKLLKYHLCEVAIAGPFHKVRVMNLLFQFFCLAICIRAVTKAVMVETSVFRFLDLYYGIYIFRI